MVRWLLPIGGEADQRKVAICVTDTPNICLVRVICTFLRPVSWAAAQVVGKGRTYNYAHVKECYTKRSTLTLKKIRV